MEIRKGITMLLKIIGAVCVITCCGFYGFNIAASKKREERCLQALLETLEYMKRELQHKRSSMTDLFYISAHRTNGPLKKVFYAIHSQLKCRTFADLSACISCSLKQQNFLPESVKNEINSLGTNLASFNITGQLKGIESVISSCEYKLKKLQSNIDQRLRTYQTLGLCAGAALVIIFI